jgi:hypothetical protein
MGQVFKIKELAVGSWQLAVGSWELAVGGWRLAVACYNLDIINSFQQLF